LSLINSTINTSRIDIEDGSSIWKDATSRLDINLWISLLGNFISSLVLAI